MEWIPKATDKGDGWPPFSRTAGYDPAAIPQAVDFISLGCYAQRCRSSRTELCFVNLEWLDLTAPQNDVVFRSWACGLAMPKSTYICQA